MIEGLYIVCFLGYLQVHCTGGKEVHTTEMVPTNVKGRDKNAPVGFG